MYKKYIKRILDLTIATIIFIFVSPIFLFITVFLAIANSGKPFFLQERPGKDEKIFKVIKFKTMNDKRDVDGKLLSDAERLTSIGRFVRKTSLDEIPQLINVIKGDMSLIGPRPLLVKYLPLYSKEQKKRHNVRPGITGWAQIHGWRGETDTLDKMEKRIEYDLWYIRHWSFWLDIRIILMTIVRGFRNKNAY
jgi:lipopolysaccharide/colanic/teichoic acid biosynthesis glycosyltransferase